MYWQTSSSSLNCKGFDCSNAVHRCNRDLLDSKERRENGYGMDLITLLELSLSERNPELIMLFFLVSRETLHPSTWCAPLQDKFASSSSTVSKPILPLEIAVGGRGCCWHMGEFKIYFFSCRSDDQGWNDAEPGSLRIPQQLSRSPRSPRTPRWPRNPWRAWTKWTDRFPWKPRFTWKSRRKRWFISF